MCRGLSKLQAHLISLAGNCYGQPIGDALLGPAVGWRAVSNAIEEVYCIMNGIDTNEDFLGEERHHRFYIPASEQESITKAVKRSLKLLEKRGLVETASINRGEAELKLSRHGYYRRQSQCRQDREAGVYDWPDFWERFPTNKPTLHYRLTEAGLAMVKTEERPEVSVPHTAVSGTLTD